MLINELGKIAQECWEDIPIHFSNVTTDAFVVMPNHVHGIIFIHEKTISDTPTRRGTIYRAPTSSVVVQNPQQNNLENQRSVHYPQSFGHLKPPFHVAREKI